MQEFHRQLTNIPKEQFVKRGGKPISKAFQHKRLKGRPSAVNFVNTLHNDDYGRSSRFNPQFGSRCRWVKSPKAARSAPSRRLAHTTRLVPPNLIERSLVEQEPSRLRNREPFRSQCRHCQQLVLATDLMFLRFHRRHTTQIISS